MREAAQARMRAKFGGGGLGGSGARGPYWGVTVSGPPPFQGTSESVSEFEGGKAALFTLGNVM